MLKFEVFRDRYGEFKWRLVDQHGHIVAISGNRYPDAKIAIRAARGVQSRIPEANVEYDQAA